LFTIQRSVLDFPDNRPLIAPSARSHVSLSLRGAHPVGAIFQSRPFIPPHTHTVPYTRPLSTMSLRGASSDEATSLLSSASSR
jgi:hypothetical protein